MTQQLRRSLGSHLLALLLLTLTSARGLGQDQKSATAAAPLTDNSVGQLISQVRGKAKSLEGTSGMQLGFQSFLAAHQLAPQSIRYSDFVIVRVLFEATRDAGFWNLHWAITDQPPNSDRIWQQWKNVQKPSALESTATAECDELSALSALLMERAGIKSVGLFCPAPNHTVAVWVVKPTMGPALRVVVPTSQVFLDEPDRFDTRKFNPWRQKTIYEYTRRDVSDAYELPKTLFNYFIQQMDKYGGASDETLQELRYLREGVFLKSWTPDQAARAALKKRSALGAGPVEDLAALQNFAHDMRAGNRR
jgi:hypothetical protein